MSRSALSGLRVVDVSETIAGQFCARLLADHGADVTVIEPLDGSAIRRLPPFSTLPDAGSLLFFHLNTGKHVHRLDQSTPAGRADFEQRVSAADVVMLPPGYDPAAIERLAPAAIITTVSSFGADGPLQHWKGPEIVLQALSGMMASNGVLGREPLYGCGARASFAAGLAAYIATTAALFHRKRSGCGQRVSIDEAETAAAMCFPYLTQHIYSGTNRSRADFSNPAGQVLCRDGWVCIWIYNHRWPAVCRVLGLADLEHDSRFAEPLPRRANWAQLFAIIQQSVSDIAADDLVDRLQRADVIAAKSARLSELAGDHHLAERGFWQSLPDGRRMLGAPYRFSRRPDTGARPSPARTPGMTVAQNGTSQGPLSGLRVIEITTAWAGPMAGRVLGFLGAEVVHVESPNRVNSWRLNKEAPNPINFPAGDPGARPYDRSFLFNSQNINKRSCILNLKIAEARAILLRLAAVSDVVICNFRPGTLAKLGLDHASLNAVRPDIIVAELPAFGVSGPMSGYAALGPTMEMAAGMSSLIGYRDGQPETTGPSYLDPIGGFNTAAAILTALLHRQTTGEGQGIEIAQVEAAMQFIGAEILAAAETGVDPERDGNRTPHAAPHDAFATLGDDEWMVIAARDDAEWQALCKTIGRPDLTCDARFATLAARKHNEDALHAIIAGWARSRDKHAASDLLQAAGVPAAPVQTPRDGAASGYLAHRGFFTELDHSDAGRHRYPALPMHLALTPGRQRSAAPAFGADTSYVLRDILGLDEAAIAQAASAGATATAPFPDG